MERTNELYEALLDHVLFTTEELELVTCMDGYSKDTLDRACMARYGMDAESVLEEEDRTWSD